MHHKLVTGSALIRTAISVWLLTAGLLGWLAAPTSAQTSSSQRTGLIFVSAEKSNAVMVLDPKTYAVTRTIATSKRPRDMHFSADRRRLYVACGDADTIDVIDVAKLAVVSRIKTGKSPELFAIDETRRRLYVANEDDSEIGVVDLDNGSRLGAIKTGGEPEGVLLADGGRTLYATSEVANLVHVIDTDKQAIVKDNVVGNRPRRFALAAGGKELWVTTELSGEVWIIDRARMEPAGRIAFQPPGMQKTDVTPVGLALSPDGRKAYVALEQAAHVAVVELPSRTPLTSIAVGRTPWGVVIDD